MGPKKAKKGGGMPTAALAAAAAVAVAIVAALLLSSGGGSIDATWADAALLRALDRLLRAVSADAQAGLASEEAAVAALAAVPVEPGLSVAVSPAVLALAPLCKEQWRLRLLFAALSLLDRLTSGSTDRADVEMQHRVAAAFKDIYPLLVGEAEVSIAEEANWRAVEMVAPLTPPAPPGTPGGDTPKGDAVAASLLTSSSYWDGGALTFVRAMHQQPAGAEHWQRVGWGVGACGSLNATAVLQSFEGDEVHHRADVIDLMEACLADADLVQTATERGAAVGVANMHGWTPLHHAALLAARSERLVDALLQAGARPDDKNSLGHTPLHVAAYRGAADAARRLLAEAPSLIDEADSRGRTPVALTCLQEPALVSEDEDARQRAADGWMGETYAVLLAAGAAPCDAQAGTAEAALGTVGKKKKGKKKKGKSKGWDDAQWGAAQPLPDGLAPDHCDIAVAPGTLSSDDFLQDYISMNRPVVIRQAALAHSPLSGKSGSVSVDEAARPWSVKGLGKRFGALQMEAVNIPYAATFEGGVVQKTTVPQFMAELAENATAGAPDAAAEGAPDPLYIFGQLEADKSPGLVVGEPEVTLGEKFSRACRPGITQLYIGGPGSGSPVHWHNDAVNYAVRGAKLW